MSTDLAEKYYKVLQSGQSFHGGDLSWSLPTENADGTWTPGRWHQVKGEIECCQNGLHLTSEPARWFAKNATCYEVEFAGKTDKKGDKIAVRRCRLLRPLTVDELAAVQIFSSGMHSVSAGMAFASGSASVTAYDSASVTAYDSASVKAYGSASVTASDSASVTAYDSASVTASGSASVTAYDSASVTASGSASVTASGSASVIVHSMWAKPVVLLDGKAIFIDRRTSPPTVHGSVQLASASKGKSPDEA